ncbi:hypothetical protein TNIN_290411 [Trichonephila inaurata madagascariensis]|uniref:Uncharacterized protein n=1 Tax=Trichonephila inaurata madagascariensis TaxID=2747483 RepID=A0A8X6WVP1_9ARAC|nr:hypothetical protein TNIN_290411 [Trichonephila inaurata madagascariensis]
MKGYSSGKSSSLKTGNPFPSTTKSCEDSGRDPLIRGQPGSVPKKHDATACISHQDQQSREVPISLSLEVMHNTSTRISSYAVEVLKKTMPFASQKATPVDPVDFKTPKTLHEDPLVLMDQTV